MGREVLSISMVLILLASFSLVLAQEELPNPGIIPDSPFYGLKKAFERLDLLFTFNDVSKARKHVELASLRLSEAKAMVDKGKPEEVEELVEEYEKNMNKSNEIAEIARGLGKNVTSVDELVAKVTSLHLSVLAEVYDKVPQQARASIERAMNKTIHEREDSVESLKQDNALGDIPEKIPLKQETKEKIPDSVDIEDEEEIELAEVETEVEADAVVEGSFDLLISDKEADIGDFTSLIVSFSKTRIFQGGGFEEIELNGTSVDLTQVIGEKSISILNIPLSVGVYNKVEMYVSNIVGLVNGAQVDVSVPSNKLQIIKPFTIILDEVTKFVFDINVVKKGNQNSYNLLPVIGKSGVVGKDLDEDEVEEVSCSVDADCKNEQVCSNSVCVEPDEEENETEINNTVPIANINASPTQGSYPLNVTFLGEFTEGNEPFSYYWDFNDTTNSTEQNVNHTFETNRTYNVSFTVTDNDTDSNIAYIIINVTE